MVESVRRRIKQESEIAGKRLYRFRIGTQKTPVFAVDTLLVGEEKHRFRCVYRGIEADQRHVEAVVAEGLARHLGGAYFACGFSRLIVDVNRDLHSPDLIPTVSDQIPVPGNQMLSEADRAARIDKYHEPYHKRLAGAVAELETRGGEPLAISVHSFTPVLNGISREVQMGVLWDKDSRLSDIFIEEFRAAGYLTGDNEPYSGRAPQDFTIDHHAEEIDLPHVGIEVRQDLIDDVAGVDEVAPVMQRIIESIPERIGLSQERIPA